MFKLPDKLLQLTCWAQPGRNTISWQVFLVQDMPKIEVFEVGTTLLFRLSCQQAAVNGMVRATASKVSSTSAAASCCC
jgi:hypothetical protein